MADIKPFKGTRYNISMIEDLQKVIAPPYDVVSKDKREVLYERHPNNVIRLILGKDNPSDDDYNNKYNRAANYLQSWRSEGVLIDDEIDSLYFYEQEFSLPNGENKKRSGFFTLVKLESLEDGKIKAHERTFMGPKADRLKLIRATKSNLSPIFSLYTDKDFFIDSVIKERAKKKPWLQCTDDEGVVHKIWVVKESKVIAQIIDSMKNRTLFIADGHHRYETALIYRNEITDMGNIKSNDPCQYVMMCLINTENEGLVVLPTHRVLNADLNADVEEVLNDLGEHFTLTKMEGINYNNPDETEKEIVDKMAKIKTTSYVMLLPKNEAYLLELKKKANLNSLIEGEMSELKKKLDVTILQEYLIKQVWIGNPEIELDEEDIKYVKDIKEAVALVNKGKASAAFIMNAPNLEMIKKIAEAGERMPEKTTYFYPKLGTGLVMRDMSIK